MERFTVDCLLFLFTTPDFSPARQNLVIPHCHSYLYGHQEVSYIPPLLFIFYFWCRISFLSALEILALPRICLAPMFDCVGGLDNFLEKQICQNSSPARAVFVFGNGPFGGLGPPGFSGPGFPLSRPGGKA